MKNIALWLKIHKLCDIDHVRSNDMAGNIVELGFKCNDHDEVIVYDRIPLGGVKIQTKNEIYKTSRREPTLITGEVFHTKCIKCQKALGVGEAYSTPKGIMCIMCVD